MTARRLAPIIGVVAISVVSATAQQPSQKSGTAPTASIERSLQSALDAYAGGDDLAPARWVAGLDDASALRSVGTVMARQPWSRSAAAFVLEVVVATHNIERLPMLLSDGRTLLARRPTPLGASPEDDRFEVLWQQTAVGILEALP